MTKGYIKRQLVLDEEDPINITILPTTEKVKIEKGASRIFLQIKNFDKFVQEVKEVKRWLNSK